ncbi:MAG: putative metal-binding motif-containing protein [Myxococcota bacterium]
MAERGALVGWSIAGLFVVGGCFADAAMEDVPGPDATTDGTADGATDDSVDATAATSGSSVDGVESDDGNASGSSGGSTEGNTEPSSTGAPPADADRDGFDALEDCDDEDATIHPDAPEICDLVDNDCDGVVDFGLSVPTHFATIGDALDAAVVGDHLCVGPGTYAEALFIAIGVQLESVEGSATTIINPAADDRAVRIADATDVRLTGFSIRGGVGPHGSGLTVSESTGVVLEDLVLHDNVALNPGLSCQGAAIRIGSSEVAARRIYAFDNSMDDCRYGGGVVHVRDSTATFDNLAIVGNDQAVGESVDAALNIIDSDTTISNLVVAGNTASATINNYGIAIKYAGAGSHALTNATVTRNTAVAEFIRRGAVYFDGNAAAPLEVALVNVANTDNVGGPGPGYGLGGGNVELSFHHTNTSGNEPESFGPTIADPTGVDGNIAVDPNYMDTASLNPVNWDLTLAPGSGMINGGTPALLDPDASVSDIGAFGGPNADAW